MKVGASSGRGRDRKFKRKPVVALPSPGARSDASASPMAWFPPRQPIGTKELILWSFAIFLLTSPFTFWLMQLDPMSVVVRDMSTMRQADSSQWRLYAARGIVLLLAAVFTVRRWRMAAPAARQLLPFLPFVLWAAASMFWSDSLGTTLNSLIAYLALILCTFLIGLRLPFNLMAAALLGSGAVLAILSIAFALFLPHYGIHQHDDFTQSVHAGAWRGVYYHKNHLGQTAAIIATGIALAGPSVIRSQKLRWGMLALMLAVILLSTSASALVIFPIAVALSWLLIILDRRERLKALLYLIPAGIVGAFLFNLFLSAVGRDATMTGRTDVWQVAAEWIAERPFAGWGYNALTYGGFSFELARRRGLTDAHSAYVETVLGTGVIGLLLFLIPIVMAWTVARRHQLAGGSEAETSLVFTSVTIAWLIASFTEVNARPFSAAGALGFFALTALLTMPVRQRAAPRIRLDPRGGRASPAHF